MVWVNLLPWRQAALQKRRRIWRRLGALMLLLLAVFLLRGQWQRQLNQQQAVTQHQWQQALGGVAALSGRLNTAQQQLKQLQLQREKQQRRQQQLAQWHDFARRLGAVFPPDIWLNALHKTPQNLTLNGTGNSIQHLHQLRDRLSEFPLFEQVVLGGIERTRSGDMTFAMQATLIAHGDVSE